MQKGICWALAALQVTPENHQTMTANDAKNVRNLDHVLGDKQNTTHPHDHHHAQNHKNANNSSNGDTTAATTGGFIAGMVGAVLSLADVGNHKNSNNSSSSSTIDKEDRENAGTTFSRDEVANHCSDDSCWLIINNRVYDVTRFLRMHPGGEDIVLEYGGHDATSAFIDKGHSPDAFDMLDGYLIGEVIEEERYPEKNHT